MSKQHVADATDARTRQDENVTSKGNNTVVSVVLFIVLFGLFVGGIYMMSLFAAMPFIIGLAMSMVALLGTFDLVPRFLT
ncbi:MAG: hypothetical protein GX960_07655 [Actinomycetales bacterium]|nr:hypothetical protein [Actinomycetales bacterium]